MCSSDLHAQWRKARGGAGAGRSRDFSRAWEALLTDAGIASAEARADAERDARELARLGLVRLKFVKYRGNAIEKLSIPVEQEPELDALFSDFAKAPRIELKFDAVDWTEPMRFVTALRPGIPFEDLLALNRFFETNPDDRPKIGRAHV